MAALVEPQDEKGEPEDGGKDHANNVAGGPARDFDAVREDAPGSYA